MILTKRASVSKVKIKDITYCEVFNHQTIIHTLSDRYSYSGTLDSLEPELDKRFFRCHRSYLVNLDYVVDKEPGIALLVTLYLCREVHRCADHIRRCPLEPAFRWDIGANCSFSVFGYSVPSFSGVYTKKNCIFAAKLDFFLPVCAVTARCAHDTNHSAWSAAGQLDFCTISISVPKNVPICYL